MRNYYFHKIESILVGLLYVFLLSDPASSSASRKLDDTDAMLVWSKRGEYGYNIHFARRTHSRWSEPIQLSFSKGEEILPTVVFDPAGHIWVAWSEIKGSDGQLRYCRFADGKWHVPETINTLTSSDLAASAIVDKNGDAWLVWSGTDATDDDIYYARWKGGSWTQPERVNSDDDLPDILPQLSLTNDGMPQVTWSGFDGEAYRIIASEWNGKAWGSEYAAGSTGNNTIRTMDDFSSGIPIELPDFVTDLSQAGMHIRQGNIVRTYRIQVNGK